METQSKPNTNSLLRFGPFEMNLRSGELHRAGVKVRLQAQPFRLLSILVERPGQVVTREQLQHFLWGNETVVDFDHGLDTAMNKIREVLEDSADNPRYIETLSKRGYRFLMPVTVVDEERAAQALSPVGERLSDTKSFFPANSRRRRMDRMLPWMLTGTVSSALVVVVALFLLGEGTRSAPLRIREVTYSGRVYPGLPLQESLAQTATDGTRIYFPQIENGRPVLAQASIGDGETSSLPIPSTIPAPVLEDISPNGSKLLVRNQLSRETEGPLWIVPALGGAAQQLTNTLAHDATWMPDGKRILFASGTDLVVANPDGSDPRKLASLPGRAFWLRWSPDGSRLRFTLLNTLYHITSLWEMSADGKSIHPLLPDWSHPASECCGSWTADGKYYVFQSTHNGVNNIWARKEDSLFSKEPFQITNGPLSYQSPITSRSGRQIFFLGLSSRSELLQYDPASKLFLPNNNMLNSAHLVRYSRDGQWVAWTRPPGSTLWRMRVDGSQRLQLTTGPMNVYMMQWSPDGRHLVLMGREPGKLWRLYQVDADGGNLHPLLNEERNEADPDWSPDGTHLVFGRPPDVLAERSQPKEIYLLDLKTGQFVPLPGSQGLFSPRWSPDGRYIAAIPLGQKELMLFDRTTNKWKTIASQPAADPMWSRDGHWIYFHDFLEQRQAIYRVSVPDGHVERAAELGKLQSVDIADFRFVGLAPGDLPLIRARMSTANIYSTDLDEAAEMRR